MRINYIWDYIRYKFVNDKKKEKESHVIAVTGKCERKEVYAEGRKVKKKLVEKRWNNSRPGLKRQVNQVRPHTYIYILAKYIVEVWNERIKYVL